MTRGIRTLPLLGLVALIAAMAGCKAAGPPEPVASATPGPPTATPAVEPRRIEVEWPVSMRLGDSDVIRLSLVPSADGYTAQLEYPEHDVRSEPVSVPYLAGYEAHAVARLDAAGLVIQPTGEQVVRLARGEAAVWRWTVHPQSAGRHRLRIQLRLRWAPLTPQGEGREAMLWEGGVELQVEAPLGLAGPQARALAVGGLLLGGVLTLPLAELAARRRLERAAAQRIRVLRPDPEMLLEGLQGFSPGDEDARLLRAAFRGYSRLFILDRFTSGYSGARTWLIQPFRSDSRSDAHVIVKIGARDRAVAEYANYTTFVRHTLPPLTGRLLGPPITCPGSREAALRYTFLTSLGAAPTSLRAFALDRPAAETARMLQERLFKTFGPTWWMQRRPFDFLLAQEYDRLLPVHLLLKPVSAAPGAKPFDGSSLSVDLPRRGDMVSLRNATVLEVRPDRGTATLSWKSDTRGFAPRVRLEAPEVGSFLEGRIVRQLAGQVVATRGDLLMSEAARALPDLDLSGSTVNIVGRTFPNPLQGYENLLAARVQGTSSVIHGDLNLENVLVGPGDLVWLIDFASTREGHTLFDFARLEVELATQVIAEKLAAERLGVREFIEALDQVGAGQAGHEGVVGDAVRLLEAVRRLAGRCLYDPAEPREFHRALSIAYLGALKFANLDELPSAPLPKALAFAGAAHLLEQLDEGT
ncbi:MAG TPA: phosphotransferase [Anaerolineales bacterium]|nr:phosphotransferase [Anaerolineales bacterium]